MTEAEDTEQGTAEEWTEAAERGAHATVQAQQRTVDLPHGCWVEIDTSNPMARLAVRPHCPPGCDPDEFTGAFGCYLEPSLVDGLGRPLAAKVRLLDKAQGVVCGVPYSALRLTPYRDTTALRSEGA